MGVLQYTANNILIAKSVDPRVASSNASLQSVGPQRLSTQRSAIEVLMLGQAESGPSAPA
jgi:hypothetical protein